MLNKCYEKATDNLSQFKKSKLLKDELLGLIHPSQ
jgi:hypothetical protein